MMMLVDDAGRWWCAGELALRFFRRFPLPCPAAAALALAALAASAGWCWWRLRRLAVCVVVAPPAASSQQAGSARMTKPRRRSRPHRCPRSPQAGPQAPRRRQQLLPLFLPTAAEKPNPRQQGRRLPPCRHLCSSPHRIRASLHPPPLRRRRRRRASPRLRGLSRVGVASRGWSRVFSSPDAVKWR